MLTLRKPIPVARAIRWVPAAGSAPPGTSPPYAAVEEPALFITQGALRDALRHARSDPGHELLGFLIGALFECPNTGAPYVVVTSSLRTGYEIPEDEPVQIPEEEWLGAQLEIRRRRSLLVGWYHSTAFVADRPARLDIGTTRSRFPEPWACGLVIATAVGATAGGFFRCLPVQPGSAVPPAAFIPFHELVDHELILGGGPKPTQLDWTNYVPAEVVIRPPVMHVPRAPTAAAAPAPEPAPVEAPPSAPPARRPPNGAANGAAPRSMTPPFTPAAARQAPAPNARPTTPQRSFAEPARASLDPALQAPHAPTLPVMIPQALTAEDMEAIEAAPTRRRGPLGAVAVVVTVAALAAGGVWYWNRSAGPELPTDGPFGRSTHAPAGATTSAPASNAAAAAQPPGGSTPGGSTPGASTPAAPAAPTAPATRGTMAPAPAVRIPPTSDPALAKFDSLSDTLEVAVRNFRDRQHDFQLQRITCTGLALGYRAADDAFIALATSYRGVRDHLDSAREARYERLERDAGAVNDEFDASQCPRP